MSIQVFKGPDGLPLPTRSGLEAAQCGHRYDALYNKGMVDESPYSLRGTAFHTWLRLYVTVLARQKERMDATIARACFHEAIRLEKTPTNLIGEVRDLVDRHAEHFELDLDRFYAAEEHRVMLNAPVPHVYRPDYEYVDFHANEIEVFDAKTYYVAYTEVQAAQVFQVRYNIWAAMQQFPKFDLFRFTFDFVRLNKKVSVQFHRDQFDELDREVRAAEAMRRQRYADQDWTAVAGEVCTFCHIACPVLDDSRRALVRVNGPEDANVNGQFILVLERELKLRKKAQKGYAVLNGAVNVNGEIFDHYTSVERTYSGAAVVDMVRSLGEEPSFDVSHSRLKGMLKRIKHLADDLLPIQRTKDKARFVHKSLKQTLRAPESEDDDDE